MRKILSIILLSLYLVSSIGVTINAHYCGGNLASLALFEKVSCCCDEEEAEKPIDCCKDEIKTIKISDDQIKGEEKVKQIAGIDELDQLPQTYKFLSVSRLIYRTLNLKLVLSPPENLNPVPIYKRNHSFLFYS